MSLAVTMNYRAKNDQREHVPVYEARFAGIPETFATHNVRNAGAQIKTLLGVPHGEAAQVYPDLGRSSIGGFTFELLDEDGFVTALVSQGITGKQVTLWGGYADIDEADFANFATVLVDEYELSPGLDSYIFTCRDAGLLANKRIFEVEQTTLSATLTAGGTSAAVANAQYFSAAPGYLLIDKEVIGYSGKTGTTFTGLTRGLFGTTATQHEANATVQEILRLGPAHPFDIAVQVMTDTTKKGAGISSSLVDTAGLITAKADLGPVGSVINFEFLIFQSENAKGWLEREIFAPTASYPMTLGSGKLSVKVFRQPASATQVAGFISEADMVEQPEWKGNLKSIANDVTFKYGYDAVAAATGNAEVYRASVNGFSQASIDKNGRFPHFLRSQGLSATEPNAAVFAAERVGAYLARFQEPAPVLQVVTLLRKHLLEPGDVVELSHSKLPNRFTQKRGITNSQMEVLSRHIDFPQGFVTFELLATGFTGRRALWGPPALKSWAQETDANREKYGFWADANGRNNNGVVAGKTWS